ncbi:MAG: 30S ribosomal protein S7 [Patescibacteria group bacterium]
MRKKSTYKKNWSADPVFNSIAVTRFINNLMIGGGKATAQKIFYQAMDEIKKQTDENPFKVFQSALKNVAPNLEVWGRRVGGASYLIPRVVRPERRFSCAVKWIVKAVVNKKGKPSYIKLADELIAASKNEGGAVKKKEDVHKQADMNRAFAHFAWWGRKKR